jgi:hypothetical protein
MHVHDRGRENACNRLGASRHANMNYIRSAARSGRKGKGEQQQETDQEQNIVKCSSGSMKGQLNWHCMAAIASTVLPSLATFGQLIILRVQPGNVLYCIMLRVLTFDSPGFRPPRETRLQLTGRMGAMGSVCCAPLASSSSSCRGEVRRGEERWLAT